MKIAFMSTGCQSSFGYPREILASFDSLTEVNNPEDADLIMANFCAISSENIDGFDGLKQKLISLKTKNPSLKVLAGGCIAGLPETKDLSFADYTFHHQEEAIKFLEALDMSTPTSLKPTVLYGIAHITIAQGCNRRCTFCKTHYLKYMSVKSRPLNEIIDLAASAIHANCSVISLEAENASEYGMDIDTNIVELIQSLLNLDGLRYLNISGICLDEVSPRLLDVLRHPKIKWLQMEVQSLNDFIRAQMGLTKTTAEALDILDALQDKVLVSNFLSGFPGHNFKEYEKEMKLIHRHHLHYLTYSPYDDTPGTPSHKLYEPLTDWETLYYQSTFMKHVAEERKLLLEKLVALENIEALVFSVNDTHSILRAIDYPVEIKAKLPEDRLLSSGDLVRVKVKKLRKMMSDKVKKSFTTLSSPQDREIIAEMLESMQYFGFTPEQILPLSGTILPAKP